MFGIGELKKIEKLSGAVPAALTVISEPPQKRTKVDIDIKENDSRCVDEREVIWLKFDGLYMTEKDKNDLILNKKLNISINYAQRILYKQFPGTEGLGQMLQKRNPRRKSMNRVQILHDRGNHSIVASMIGFESK